MLIYFIVLFIATFGMWLAQRSEDNSSTQKILVFITFLVFVLLAGLRSDQVGTDTGNYIRMFNSDKIIGVSIFDTNIFKDYGYFILMKISRIVSTEYWALLISIAIVVVYLSLRVITDLSYDYSISIFIFITLGTYVFFFNGARQALAASIYGMAIIHILNGNFKKYFFWVIIAALFHKTVLITLPVYFLFRMKYSLKNFIVLTVFTLILFSLMWKLIALFPDEYSNRFLQYEDRGATGAGLLTIFNALITIFFIFMRQYISYDDRYYYDKLLYMVVFNGLIYVLVYLTGQDVNLIRLTIFFSFGAILLWPFVFKNISFLNNIFFKLGFYSIHLIFYYVYLTKMSALTPYYFNPDLFYAY